MSVWQIEFSPEVAAWFAALSDNDLATAQVKLGLLEKHGPMLRMPHAKYLGEKLWELRFALEGVNRRITYLFDEERRVVTLTTFRKQRQNEAREVLRARKALKALKAHTARRRKEQGR